ncbi:MAG TPA: glycosyltransferase [Gemmatimonadaceae bacterium]|nr:glycosyltransferase [Gemmatimonadaceae bacterium]
MTTPPRVSRGSDGTGRASSLAIPHLSVVVASASPASTLRVCLRSLLDQPERSRAELIVARSTAHDDLEALTSAYPSVRFVDVPGALSIPDLRAAGMRECTGDVVIVMDDGCLPGPRWLEEVSLGVDNLPSGIADPGLAASEDEKLGESDQPRPLLSVIIPVRNGKRYLPQMLETLSTSNYPRERWELIVVDDGSSDDSAILASRFADVIIKLPGRARGPGYARNRGVERARGQWVAFLDADVVVRPDTLQQITETLTSRSDIGAVFGSYCDEPSAAGLVSQYRNLLHHYMHDQDPGEVHSFWAGCGAVRRDVFIDVGMYDEWRFSRAQIEDIELGYRMTAHGHRILLRPDIQVTHLKRWTFWGMLRADFIDRGVPWARLLAEQRALLGPAATRLASLNLRAKEKSNAFFTCLGGLLVVLSIALQRPRIADVGLALILLVILRGLSLYAFFFHKRGFIFAVSAIVLHLIYYVTAAISVTWGAMLAVVVGEPRPDPSIEAFSELNFAAWPPVPKNPGKRIEKPVVAKV